MNKNDNDVNLNLTILRRFLEGQIKNYARTVKEVQLKGMYPYWIKAFWRAIGNHPVSTQALFVPTENQSKLINELEAIIRVKEATLPNRYRLIAWDTFTYYFTNESGKNDDPPVLGFNADMDKPERVNRSFLEYATGIVVRVSLPLDDFIANRYPAGSYQLFAHLHPRIRIKRNDIYVPFDDNENVRDDRLIVARLKSNNFLYQNKFKN